MTQTAGRTPVSRRQPAQLGRESADRRRVEAGSRQGEGQLVELRPPPPADLGQPVAQLAELAEQLGARPVGLAGQHVGDPVGLGQARPPARDEHHPALVVQRVGLLGGRGLADPRADARPAATLVPATRASTWATRSGSTGQVEVGAVPVARRRPDHAGVDEGRAGRLDGRSHRGEGAGRDRVGVDVRAGEAGACDDAWRPRPRACGGSTLRTTSAPSTRAAGRSLAVSALEAGAGSGRIAAAGRQPAHLVAGRDQLATDPSAHRARVQQRDDRQRLSCGRRTGWSPTRRRRPRGCRGPAAGRSSSTVSLSKRFSSPIGSVSVTTTSLTREFFSRSIAGPEKTAWVAAMMTSAAPASNSASAALVMVPPVSIMSSCRMQVLPVDVTDDPVGDRLVGHQRVAGLVDERDRGAAEGLRPALGEPQAAGVGRDDRDLGPVDPAVDVAGEQRQREQVVDRAVEEALDLRVCRSTAIRRSAPAVLKKSAISRAEIGSRPRCFLSWRA